MTGIRSERVCQICRAPLDIESRDGEIVGFRHTLRWLDDHVEDHQPAPVPLDEFTSIEGYCDFCGGSHPTVTFGWLDEIRVIYPGVPTMDFSRDWAACENCAVLIRTRRINGLVARVVRSMRDRGVLAFDAGAVEVLYRKLFSEPFVEAPLTEDDPFGLKETARKLEELRNEGGK